MNENNASKYDLKCLYIKNIPPQMSQKRLIDFFSTYGTVSHLFKKEKHDNQLTFGFVHFTEEKDASDALAHLQENSLGLHLQFARNKENDPKRNYPKSSQQAEACTSIHKILDDAFSKYSDKPTTDGSSESSSSHNVCDERPKQQQNRRIPHMESHEEISSRKNNTRSSDFEKNQQLQNFLNKHKRNNDEKRIDQLSKNAQPKNVEERKSHSAISDCSKCSVHSHQSNDCLRTDNESVCSSHSSHGCHRDDFVLSRGHSNIHNSAPFPSKSNYNNMDSNLPRLQKNLNSCSFCNKEACYYCADCGEAYCSQECQVRDWSKHSRNCKPNQRNPESSSHSRFDRYPDDGLLQVDQRFERRCPTLSSGESPYFPKRDGFRHGDHLHRDTFVDNHDSYEERSMDSATSNSSTFRGRRFAGDVLVKTKLMFPQHDLSVNFKTPCQSRVSGFTLSSVSPSKRKKFKDLRKAYLNSKRPDMVTVTVCNNPREFWVVRKSDEKHLRDIEIELSRLNKNRVPFHDPSFGDLCCVLYNNCLYRCTVMKVYPKSLYDVYFIDYGHSDIVNASILYELSGELMEIPALAVGCKLFNVKPQSDICSWRSSDVDFFFDIVSNKVFEAHVEEALGTKIALELTADDGSLISSIMVNENHAKWISSSLEQMTSGGKMKSPNSKYVVPSVLEKLKPSIEVNVCPVFVDEGDLWGWVEDEELTAQIQDLESEIDDGRGEEITLTSEKDDLVVAYSPSHHKWFRCIVVDRSSTSITVRYIDYGIEEMVPKVFKIPDEQINVPSPLVHCKIDRIPNNILDIVIKDGFQATVKKVSETVELSCIIESTNFPLTAHPWHYGLAEERKRKNTSHKHKEILSGQFVSKQKHYNNKKVSKLHTTQPEKPFERIEKISPKPEKLHTVEKIEKVSPNKIKLSIAKDILCNREIPTSGKVPVQVVWAKSRTEIYVQKLCDLPQLEKLCKTINEWCRSAVVAKAYMPEKGDIVCAKYAADEQWYRSLVLNVSSNQLEVCFVDYGNVEIVAVDNVRQMKEPLNECKFAILVCLDNVPTMVASVGVVQILCNKVLEMEVIDANSTPKKVTLYEKGKNVFASWNDDPTTTAVKTPEVPILKKGCIEERVDAFCDSDVRISHIDSKVHFHVQSMSSREEYFKLLGELKKDFPKDCSSSFVPQVDDIVCFSFKNNVHRGCIIKSSLEKCLVRSVDDGFVEEISINDIRPLKEVIFKHALCIEVELDGLNSEIVTVEDCEKLKNCPLKLEIVDNKCRPVKGKFYLEGLCINDALMDEALEREDQSKKSFLKSFKQQTLTIGKVLEVVFYFCENQKYFLQRLSDLKAMVCMSDSLQKHCSSSLEKCLRPSEGEVVCAKSSEDGLWYRGSIEKVLDSKSCQVRYIDYGNREVVANENLRLLYKELAELPIFGISVNFKNAPESVAFGTPYTVVTSGSELNPVVELSSSVKSKIYLFESLKKQSLSLNESVAVTFQFCTDNTFYVHRVNDSKSIEEMSRILQQLPTKGEPFSVMPKKGEIVCTKCSEDQLWYRACVKEVVHKLCEVSFIDYGNSEKVEMSNLYHVPDDIASYPIFAIPVSIKNPQPIHVGAEYLVEVEGTEQNLIVTIIDPKAQKAETVEAKPSQSFYSLSMFSKQSLPQNKTVHVIFQYSEGDKFFVHKFSDTSDILKLMEILQNVCSKEKPLSQMPSVGDVVCAKCPEDQVWYRACIEKTTSTKEIVITYIDYGNRDKIELVNLCQLPEEVAKLPIFAISVSIKNPQPIHVGVQYSVTVGGSEQNPVVEILDANSVKAKTPPRVAPRTMFLLPTFQKQSLPLNQTVDVVFQCCENDKFFVQKVTDIPRFKELHLNLQKCCQEAKPLVEVLVPNEVVCARSSKNGTWYRASMNKKIDSQTYEVNFIDLGRNETVKLHDLRNLPENAATVPIFAISVCIDNPQPLTLESEYLVLVLNEDKCQRIQFIMPEPCYKLSSLARETLTVGDIVDVVFVHKVSDNLFLQKKCDIESIAVMTSLLQSHCVGSGPIMRDPIQGEVLCSLSQKHSWSRVSIENIRNDGSHDVFFIDYGYISIVQKKNLYCLPADIASLSIFGISVRCTNSADIEFGLECKVKVSGMPNNLMVELQPKIVPIKPPSRLQPANSEVSKFQHNEAIVLNEPKVTVPLLSDCKYVDFPNGNVDVIIYSVTTYDAVFCAPYIESNIVANATLSQEIVEFCEKSDSSGYKPSVSREMILAKFPDDGCWYRAVVSKILGDEIFVHFVDYGGVSILNQTNIRRMMPQFMKLPIQAHCCVIDGLDVNEEQEDAVTAAVVEALVPFSRWNSIVSRDGDVLYIEIPKLKEKLINAGLVS